MSTPTELTVGTRLFGIVLSSGMLVAGFVACRSVWRIIVRPQKIDMLEAWGLLPLLLGIGLCLVLGGMLFLVVTTPSSWWL